MKMPGAQGSKGKWKLQAFKICGMDAGGQRASQGISGDLEGPPCKFPYFATLEELMGRM